MNTPLVTCNGCHTPLLAGVFNLEELTPCPACGKPLQIAIFPALFRHMAAGRGGEAVVEEMESSCFYHPQKRAVLPCDGCGRFLCALCDCDFNGQHLCPPCLETGKAKGKIQNLQNHRTLYDSVALTLAIAPAITFVGACFSIITSPLALFIALRHWNTPTSIVRTTKTRHVLAIIFATLTLLGWISYAVLIGYAVWHAPNRH